MSERLINEAKKLGWGSMLLLDDKKKVVGAVVGEKDVLIPLHHMMQEHLKVKDTDSMSDEETSDTSLFNSLGGG